jgi:hypothetical protein
MADLVKAIQSLAVSSFMKKRAGMTREHLASDSGFYGEQVLSYFYGIARNLTEQRQREVDAFLAKVELETENTPGTVL